MVSVVPFKLNFRGLRWKLYLYLVSQPLYDQFLGYPGEVKRVSTCLSAMA